MSLAAVGGVPKAKVAFETCGRAWKRVCTALLSVCVRACVRKQECIQTAALARDATNDADKHNVSTRMSKRMSMSTHTFTHMSLC